MRSLNGQQDDFKGFKSVMFLQVLTRFFWGLTIGSAIVFVIGALAAGWSWSLLWLSLGGLVLTFALIGITFARLFSVAGKDM